MKSNIDLVRLTHNTFYFEKKWGEFFDWLERKINEEKNPWINDICLFVIIILLCLMLFFVLFLFTPKGN